MNATFSLGSTWPAPAAVTVTAGRRKPYPPAGLHPITQDPAALERALIAVLESAKHHAVSAGRRPDDDMQNDAFRKQNGRLAAMLANPVEEAHIEAVNMLVAHGMLLLPPDRFNAMVERVGVRTAHLPRHIPDTRQRH